jgi:hypothetical protein
VGEADVKNKRIARIERNVGYAATHHCRTDGTRLEIFEKDIG